MKQVRALLLVLTLLLSACSAPNPTAAPTNPPSPGQKAVTLNVFAAASLVDAFNEIGKAFEAANPGITVKLNFAGSQALRTQIEQGAQADVFASANTKEMDALVQGNLVKQDTPRVFLANQLLVIMPAKNPANLVTLADLAKPGTKLVLAAREVPVGNYSLQVLEKLNQSMGAGYQDQVLANVVSYENDVKQVVAKVQLGEADAGIVYSSDSVAAPGLQKIAIAREDNVIATYPIAALAQSPNAELAQAFISYVLSTEGQDTLYKWGFLPVQ